MDIPEPPIHKVMVSGCFDLLHSGHVAFLQEAAALGALHVCIARPGAGQPDVLAH